MIYIISQNDISENISLQLQNTSFFGYYNNRIKCLIFNLLNRCTFTALSEKRLNAARWFVSFVPTLCLRVTIQF